MGIKDIRKRKEWLVPPLQKYRGDPAASLLPRPLRYQLGQSQAYQAVLGQHVPALLLRLPNVVVKLMQHPQPCQEIAISAKCTRF